MFARHIIDVLDFARDGKELRGEIPVSDMARIQDSLASSAGKVSYVLCGWQNREGKLVLELSLTGTLQLRCQRCLQGMTYHVDTRSRLMPVPEDELGDPSSEEDGLDLIPIQEHIDVLELIEEDILLGLPMAPMHEPGKCIATRDFSTQAKENPFAVLGQMREKQG